jgi:hypothetical protein
VELNFVSGKLATQVWVTPWLLAVETIEIVVAAQRLPADAASSVEGTSLAVMRLGSLQPANRAVLNKRGTRDDLIVFIIFGVSLFFIFAVMIRKSFAAAVSKI